MEYISILEQMINLENKVIQSYRKMAFFLLVISLVLILLVVILVLLPAHGDRTKMMYGMLEIGGGLFISSLAVFPLKEIINHKDKIALLEMLEEFLKSTGNTNEMRDNIDYFIAQSMEKIALGSH